MRRLLALPLLAVPLAGCAHTPRPIAGPPPQSTSGTPDVFGTGVVAVSPAAITVQLTTPAYLALVLVFPGDSARLVYPPARYAGRLRLQEDAVSIPLAAGTRTVHLPATRSRTWMETPPQYTSSNIDDELTDPSCIFQRARERRPRDSSSTAPPPSQQPPCARTPERRHTESRGGSNGRWVMGAPVPLAEHYLVVIAADQPFDRAAVEELLVELDISLASGEAAAHAVPGYLVGGQARWGAWIVHRP